MLKASVAVYTFKLGQVILEARIWVDHLGVRCCSICEVRDDSFRLEGIVVGVPSSDPFQDPSWQQDIFNRAKTAYAERFRSKASKVFDLELSDSVAKGEEATYWEER